MCACEVYCRSTHICFAISYIDVIEGTPALPIDSPDQQHSLEYSI